MENKKNVNFIRKSWFDIFIRNGYRLILPVSLIPKEDESLLWINSGVSTLKKYFSNPELLPSRNLVNCQPVIRTDDIDEINDENPSHQTMFEMLGSFSVGGNFKTQAISIIWEWLTNVNWLNIDSKKLFVTVWKEDIDSYDLWKKQGIEEDHILLGSKETNFWQLGPGPCGANTEIFYCFEKNYVTVKEINELETNSFIEIGNMVFPDLFYQGDDNYFSLKEKCVDIGFGLERLAMVLQNKSNTFAIDIWEPIISEITR